MRKPTCTLSSRTSWRASLTPNPIEREPSVCYNNSSAANMLRIREIRTFPTSHPTSELNNHCRIFLFFFRGLHQAVLFDDTRFFLFIVRLLIMLRSQIDIVDRRNANDETVLHLLAYKNKPQGIKCLLLANADVSLQDRGGNTALHIGVRQKCLQVLQVLLQNQDAAKRYIDQKNNGRS